MTTATKQQLTAIATLCSRLNIDKESKAVMVAGFSASGEASSKQLTFAEAKQMISHLLSLQLRAGTNKEDPGAKMKGKICSICKDMGWTKTSKLSGKIVADVARFDAWAVERSYSKKKLNAYKYAELPKLVSQFEAVYKSFLKKV